MNRHRFALWLTCGLLAAAIGLLLWQQSQLAQSRSELARLRAEVAQLTVSREQTNRVRESDADQAELKRLRQEKADRLAEMAKLRGQAAAANRAETEAAQLRSALASQVAESASGTNPAASPMAAMMKGAMEQQFQGRLARLQAKLSLTPEQSRAVQEILARQSKTAAEAMQMAFSGKSSPQQLAKLQEGQGNPEAEIQALLSPEQREAYQAFKDEEALGNARLVANSELLQMQNTLDLTQEQQDKVFNALYSETLAQLKGQGATTAPKSPAEAIQAALDRKVQALEGVLTPTQLETYRKQQELQTKFAKEILGNMGAAPAKP